VLQSPREGQPDFTWSPRPRPTPRKSLVVILPENHVVPADYLAERLRTADDEEMDVIVACAGEPVDLNLVQRAARTSQFILAPAGTSREDLRELAMMRASGDIVTLVTGQHLDAALGGIPELLKTT
jgi:hypothetical protein